MRVAIQHSATFALKTSRCKHKWANLVILRGCLAKCSSTLNSMTVYMSVECNIRDPVLLARPSLLTTCAGICRNTAFAYTMAAHGYDVDVDCVPVYHTAEAQPGVPSKRATQLRKTQERSSQEPVVKTCSWQTGEWRQPGQATTIVLCTIYSNKEADGASQAHRAAIGRINKLSILPSLAILL